MHQARCQVLRSLRVIKMFAYRGNLCALVVDRVTFDYWLGSILTKPLVVYLKCNRTPPHFEFKVCNIIPPEFFDYKQDNIRGLVVGVVHISLFRHVLIPAILAFGRDSQLLRCCSSICWLSAFLFP